MNVLQFADYSAPYEGNFIASLRGLEKLILNMGGSTVYVFPFSASEKRWAKELDNIYFLTGNFKKDISLLKRIIKKHSIQIIHTHFSVFKYDLLIRIARIFSHTTIYVRHMHMIYKNKNNLFLEMIKRMINNVDIEIACSKAAFDSMEEAGLKNIHLVTNGINFNRLDDFKKLSKKDFGLSEDNKIVLMLGYDYIIKGVDIAVEAIKNLDNVYLFIVVAANDTKIEKQIFENYGEANFVKLLPPRKDIASYFKLCDLFLSASRVEGFCYALREAGYAGTLLLASDIKAHREMSIVETFENENAEDLKEKLIKILNTNEKDEVIKAQKEYIVSNYSIQNWSNNIVELYKLKCID